MALTVSSIGFSYFTSLLFSYCAYLAGGFNWIVLQLVDDLMEGTEFNGAETNCTIASNLGILLMNSNCFAIYFKQHFSLFRYLFSIFNNGVIIGLM